MSPPRFVKVDTECGGALTIQTNGDFYTVHMRHGVEPDRVTLTLEDLRMALAMFPEVHGPEAKAARDLIRAVAKIRSRIGIAEGPEMAFHAAWNEYMSKVTP